MTDTPRTILVSEPTSYDVLLSDLTPKQHRRVMDALADLQVGLQTTVTAKIELTPEVTAQIIGTETLAAPGVSIAGRDATDTCEDTCQRCGHLEHQHTGPVSRPGYGPECGYVPGTKRCPCAGWVPGGYGRTH